MKWHKTGCKARHIYKSDNERFLIDHFGCNMFALFDYSYDPKTGEGKYWTEFRTMKEAKVNAENRIAANGT